MEVMVWGLLQRAAEGLLDGSSTLVAGLVIAACLRHFLGSDGIRRLFGDNTRRGLLVAWLLGMLLPVCSLGVIPVAMEMRRAGIRQGTILAFALTAPLFNPLSLLYGLTLSAPLLIGCFALASLLLVTAVGLAWDRGLASPPEAISFPASRPGWTRIALVGLSAARNAAGPLLLYVVVAIGASALLAALLPKGSLGNQFSRNDPWAPLLMCLISVPLYTTPLTVMSQIGSMFLHGNSMGAAYVLLVLGTGCNVGLMVWIGNSWGWRSAVAWTVVCMAILVPLGYAIHVGLESSSSMERPHSHAFDIYSQPFAAGEMLLPQRVARHLGEEDRRHQWLACELLGLLSLAGAILRYMDPRKSCEAYLECRGANLSGTGRYDVHLGPTSLKLVLSAGLLAASVLSCYVYFPDVHEVLEEMRVVKADALSAAAAGQSEESLRQIAIYDDLTRRLQVGHYLRTGELTEYQRAKATVLREQLERLKDHLEAGELERVSKYIVRISDAHSQLRAAFLPPAAPSESAGVGPRHRPR